MTLGTVPRQGHGDGLFFRFEPSVGCRGMWRRKKRGGESTRKPPHLEKVGEGNLEEKNSAPSSGHVKKQNKRPSRISRA